MATKAPENTEPSMNLTYARQTSKLAPTPPPFFPMKEEVRTAVGLRKAQRGRQHATVYPRVTSSLEGPTAPQSWNLNFPQPPSTRAKESTPSAQAAEGQVSIL